MKQEVIEREYEKQLWEDLWASFGEWEREWQGHMIESYLRHPQETRDQVAYEKDLAKYQQEYADWGERLGCVPEQVPGDWHGEPPRQHITDLRELAEYLEKGLDLAVRLPTAGSFDDVLLSDALDFLRNGHTYLEKLGIHDGPSRPAGKDMEDPDTVTAHLQNFLNFVRRRLKESGNSISPFTEFVTLKEIADRIGRSKRTLEKQRYRDQLGPPQIKSAGSSPAKWDRNNPTIVEFLKR